MYLRLNTQYNPFTYDELVKPLADYGRAYRELEDQYNELSATANVWDSLQYNPNDKDVYEQYKSYNKDLSKEIEDLTTNGLTGNNRKALLNMKARYNREIVPIAQAYQNRQKYASLLQEAYKDPTAIVDRDVNDIGLSEFIKNPNLMPKIQSGALITKRVADKVKNYANSEIKAGKWRGTGPESQLLERVVTTGLTRNDIQAIINNPKAFPEITKLIDDVVDTTGVSDWRTNPTAYKKALAYAYEGLYAGIGKQDVDVRKNEEHSTPYQRFMMDKSNSDAGSNKKTATSNIDRTFYSFPRDVERIANFLDKEGKLGFKTGYGNFAKNVFKNGKWHKPTGNEYSYQVLKPAGEYYDAINSILINAGYTQDRLNDMSKEDIETALKKIKDDEAIDGIRRDLYRTSLDDAATEHLFSKMQEKGYKFQKIEGFKDEKGKHIPIYGSGEKIEYVPKSTTSIHLDPVSRDFVMLYGGEWYKVPKDLISNDLVLSIEDAFAQDDEGFSKFSKAQNTYNELMALQKKRKLTARELNILIAAREAVLDMDSRMGEIGKYFAKYVGTQNTQ